MEVKGWVRRGRVVPDVGAGWRSQPRGAPTFGVPWVGVPPHGVGDGPWGPLVTVSQYCRAPARAAATAGATRTPSATCIQPRCHLYPSCTPCGPSWGLCPAPAGLCCRAPWVWGLLCGGVAPMAPGKCPLPNHGGPPPYPLLPSTDPPH